MEYQEIPLEHCYESPRNNRRTFNADALEELTDSVRSKGVLTPLLVRPNRTEAGFFEILAGARRFRAAKAAGLESIPARVKELTDGEALEIIVIENGQREDLHPLEEADGYRSLLDQPGYDVAAIAAKVHKSESYVHQRVKLTELIDEVRDAFLAGRILLGHALLVARLQPADQSKALADAFTQQWDGEKYGPVLLSVNALARKLAEGLCDLRKAIFDPADAELLPDAGACTPCPKRTGSTPSLFPDIAQGDTCTDGRCFKSKVVAYLAAREAALAAKGTAPLRLSMAHKARKGVLNASQWRHAKAKECDAASKGLIVDVDGYNGNQLGKVLTVCADPACTVHRPRAASSGASSSSTDDWEARHQRENAKRARRIDVHRQIFIAVAERVPKKLGRPELERLALALIDDCPPDSDALLAPLLGVEAPTKAWDQTELREHIAKLTEPHLARLLAVLPLVDDVDGYRALEHFEQTALCAAAAHYGVDVVAIEAAARAEAREREAKEKAAAKEKATATAPKKAKASKKGKAKK